MILFLSRRSLKCWKYRPTSRRRASATILTQSLTPSCLTLWIWEKFRRRKEALTNLFVWGCKGRGSAANSVLKLRCLPRRGSTYGSKRCCSLEPRPWRSGKGAFPFTISTRSSYFSWGLRMETARWRFAAKMRTSFLQLTTKNFMSCASITITTFSPRSSPSSYN